MVRESLMSLYKVGVLGYFYLPFTVDIFWPPQLIFCTKDNIDFKIHDVSL